MAKKKPTLNNSSEDEEKDVLEYMNKANRPYSANDVFNNMHAKYSKPRVIKALDKLVEDGELMSKVYGKTSIYSTKQEIVKNEEREQILDALSNEITQLSEELGVMKGENKRLEEELSKVKSEVTTIEATEFIKQYKESTKTLQERLDKLTSGVALVPLEKRKRVDDELELYRRMWKKRNNMAKVLGIEEDEIPFENDPFTI
ncbi:hypothetical protein G6F56_008821 [Rhizopus delemar]|nr:hypothetical protein G6F56_008821 [Rhizopus delemar]